MGSKTKFEQYCEQRFESDGQTENSKSSINKESGFISLLIILVITILALIGAAGLSLVQAQSKYIRQEADKVRCVYIAEGGLEWARASLMNSMEWSGGIRDYYDGSVIISVEPDIEGFMVIADAQSGTARREIKVLLKIEDYMNIVRYEEMH